MRRPVTVLIAATMLSAAVTEAAAAPVVTRPDWLKRPDAGDLAAFWPANAGGVGGTAWIRCIVTARGLLDKCFVVEETPVGHGFGTSALLLAPLFLMRPQLIDGVPVSGAVITIPIHFDNPGSAVTGQKIRVSNNLAWSEVPTATELAKAFPKEAVGHTAIGRVVLRCRVATTGGLVGCKTSTEEPRDSGFARAAVGLSKAFRVVDTLRSLSQVPDHYVDVPFDFRDPSLPTPPVEVNAPDWLQQVDPASAEVFPDAAAKLGFKTGRAVIACEVAHDGALTHCAVASEDPPALGFGAEALAIAGVMKMNPWTKQGDPVDGAHIRLPIRLDLHEPSPAAQSVPPPGK